MKPGGDTTVPLVGKPSLARPATNLDEAQKASFYVGKALATQPWVRAPTTTDARDGLGPLYHARACLGCHVDGGRGQASVEGASAFATLVRLSRGRGPHGEPSPDPVYGPQLQPQSTALSQQVAGHGGFADDGVPAEADVRIEWVSQEFIYPDGHVLTLRTPSVRLEHLAYGPLHADTRAGLRHTPSLAGIGLLAMIEQADLDALADPRDGDGDGISGRGNRVWDPESGTLRPGRFGLKANMPSVRVQVGAALQQDMGLSNPVFPTQPCTSQQPRCQAAPSGDGEDGLEVSASLLSSVVFFAMSIGVPERRRPGDPIVQRGQGLFDDLGCRDCHVPHFTTGSDPAFPHLAGQEIWPYTDLLLHDMGPDLADGREDFDASGSEWRTPPLWSVGLARAMHARVGFLHDGRARTVEEAIVWHGGEAQASRDRFAALGVDDRLALLSFVRSL